MKINHDRRRQKPTIRTLHRTMRAVVCALWVLTTASCAHAAASFTVLTWLPGDNFNYNTTGVSGDGSVVVGTSGEDTSYGNNFYIAFRWTAGSGMVSVGAGYESFANCVSADGTVVVGTSESNYLSPDQAFHIRGLQRLRLRARRHHRQHHRQQLPVHRLLRADQRQRQRRRLGDRQRQPSATGAGQGYLRRLQRLRL